ncbi:camp-dependent protein kinase catalytic subunit [Gonapodya prolifera JEL478]|uniref:cAMP-dependent protein kinase n=1 Tax=Gonapodya prolifera (strain JEL478) TaxID=1344416 RepID=A0A139A5I3_GONPJ|nr:camp-dependent protein kinase catalytic subunit [Gonapodya prolifera JEL478]|eukprot:KXS11908.1 camp-dependent protein kinase catalytic subunit [Gonapodya prolifera JEL478]
MAATFVANHLLSTIDEEFQEPAPLLTKAVQSAPTAATAVESPAPPLLSTPAGAESTPVVSQPAIRAGNFTNGSIRGYSLQDFELLETLGTGTFGRVYLCRYVGSEQYYAMKVLKKAEVVRLKQVEHINSEKDILSQLNHPFIVNLFCTFQDEKCVYMLLEYVCGGELFSHLRRAGRFSNDMTKFYAAEIVSAIEFMHARNIIYRDLKPENLLLDSKGHVKIADFGFAKKVDDRTWTLCGTPEYLAPEIIQSKGHGKAVDWWALGILIYEMLAGYPPFYDENPFGIYEKILAGKIAFPSNFDVNAKDLIKRLLTADRTKRLGNLKGGAEDVKQHKWFKNVNWVALVHKQIRAPIIPTIRHPGDTSNFGRMRRCNIWRPGF